LSLISVSAAGAFNGYVLGLAQLCVTELDPADEQQREAIEERCAPNFAHAPLESTGHRWLEDAAATAWRIAVTMSVSGFGFRWRGVMAGCRGGHGVSLRARCRLLAMSRLRAIRWLGEGRLGGRARSGGRTGRDRGWGGDANGLRRGPEGGDHGFDEVAHFPQVDRRLVFSDHGEGVGSGPG
jgi:hypothetical protein